MENSGTTKCRSCGREVSESVKYCPHCGTNLNKSSATHRLLKGVGVLFAILIAILVFGNSSNSSDEQSDPQEPSMIEQLEQARLSMALSDDLENYFSYPSDYTDVQRENKEAEITGQVIRTEIEVYDVMRRDGHYEIETSGEGVDKEVHLYPRDHREIRFIEALSEYDRIWVKGLIEGVSATRNVVLDPAILVMDSRPDRNLRDSFGQAYEVEVTDMTELSQESRAGEGFKTVALRLLIDNLGEGTDSYDASCFKARPNGGGFFSPVYEAGPGLSAGPSLGSGSLAPGEKTEGWITFEIRDHTGLRDLEMACGESDIWNQLNKVKR